MTELGRTLLIHGGRVYRHDGDRDRPALADILVVGEAIAAVRPGLLAEDQAGGIRELGGRPLDDRLDATDRLVIPGLINSHYHSHDTLLKGCFETMPVELWFLTALPSAFPKRSRAELRARTLLGAIECLRGGITTIQDLATISPFDEEHLEAVLRAYDEVGIRCVFALQLADVRDARTIPFWDEVAPADLRGSLAAAVPPPGSLDPAALMRASLRSWRGRHRLIQWALGPSSPERSSAGLLRTVADLARDEDLRVFTHIYESKAQAVSAQATHPEDGGSLVTYLDRCGLLTERLSLAHSVWIQPAEINRLAEAGAGVVLNPVGNLKTRSGVAPVADYLSRGVTVGLGCDNCSCSDAQNLFQAMKFMALLPAIADTEPGMPSAADALEAATSGGARLMGQGSHIGAVEPGMQADMAILDLRDPSFVPLNSAVRQLVFTESGRAVESVLVAGRIVVRDRRVVTVDEDRLRNEIEALADALRFDLKMAEDRISRLGPYILEARRRWRAAPIGLERYLGQTSS